MSLDSLFDQPLTELVNIGKETPSHLSISQRVQLWLKQSDRNVYIGRGSDWGNPYSHLPVSAAVYKTETVEEAIECYRKYLLTRPDLLSRIHEFQGKRLGCWCYPKQCHGNVLLELIWKIVKEDREVVDVVVEAHEAQPDQTPGRLSGPPLLQKRHLKF